MCSEVLKFCFKMRFLQLVFLFKRAWKSMLVKFYVLLVGKNFDLQALFS